jgi:hypothetical protein
MRLCRTPNAARAHLVEEQREVGELNGGVEVGVWEDDRGRLAAQLQGHVLERTRGLALNDAAHLRGSREGHLRRQVRAMRALTTVGRDK